MPWNTIELNNGTQLPSLGFGTWKIPKENTAENVELAFECGFAHIDTAQAYRNEEEVGQAIKESALPREQIWVTTKWSGFPWGDGASKSPEDSIAESLQKLGLDHLDLYLVHTPRLFSGRIKESWPRLEALVKSGQTKGVGISNFTLSDVKTLLHSGEKGPEIKPVVNQIELHPYNWHESKANVEFCQKHGIAIEAYSPLKPLTTYPGGPLDKPLKKIAERLNAKPEQVLLAWVKAKGAIALTTSTRKERLSDYVTAGDLELTHDDIKAIEKAGAKGPGHHKRAAVRIVTTVAVQVAAFALIQWYSGKNSYFW